MKLSSKIVTVFVLSLLAMTTIISFSLYTVVKNALQPKIIGAHVELVRHTIDQIDQFLYERLKNIQAIAESGEIEDFLAGKNRDNVALEREVNQLADILGDFAVLRIADKNGRVVYSTRGEKEFWEIKKGSNAMTALASALEGETYYSDAVMSKTLMRPSIIFASPVRNCDLPRRPVTGAVIGYVSWSSILSFIENVHGEQVDLYNRDGFMLGSNERELDRDILKVSHKDDPFFRHALGHGPEDHWDLPDEGKGMLVVHAVERGYKTYKGNSWFLTSKTQASEALGDVEKTAKRLVLAFAPVIAIFLVVMVLFVKTVIVRPIDALVHTTKLITAGNLDRRADVASRDEIGQLGGAFNEMTAKLEDSHKMLEHNVWEKTRELAGRVEELEAVKKALLNVNDDLGLKSEELMASEEEMRASNEELQSSQEELMAANEELQATAEELKNANERLKDLDQLKSDFVATVSHELRTPLAITKEGISIVLDESAGEINDKQKNMLFIAKNNIDRLSNLINDLLDISKIEAGKLALKKELFDMGELIDSTVAAFKSIAEKKGVQIRRDIPARGTLATFADKDKITQVFVNLANNAIKFTDKGTIDISAVLKGDVIECLVADTGKGIERHNIPKVFQKFQQFDRAASSVQKGTGLGLAICKGIVELHGGEIRVESQFGKGTKFIFTVPVGEDKKTEKRKNEKTDERKNGHQS